MKTLIFLALILLDVTIDAFIPGVIDMRHRKLGRTFCGEKSPSLATSTIEDAELNDVHHAITHKRWGVDNGYANEYWYDRRIHTLGNKGFGGAVHAATAAIATKVIDMAAYDGVSIRAMVSEELAGMVGKNKARVVDLCCGVGISTRALRQAFPGAEAVVGIDTSPEMIAMAAFLTNHLSVVKPVFDSLQKKISIAYLVLNEQSNIFKYSKTFGRFKKQSEKMKQCMLHATNFALANAENTQLPEQSFDLVTIMYAFHEAPREGRDRILQEAHRLLQPGGILAVLDISPEYTPSKSMLSGEPYVIEYQSNIHEQLRTFEGFQEFTYQNVVPGHVGMWCLKREPSLEVA